MNFAIFVRPVVTIYDLTETTKESDAGVVSTIGDEGLYGQVCQVRTAPGGVTAEGVTLPEEMAEVVSFYGYHGYVFASELQFCGEAELRSYLAAEWVMAGRATDVLTLPKVQGVRLAELERGRTGISVKMLIKVCKVLGLSADYVLFGNDRPEDSKRLDAIRRIDEKYLPLLDKVIAELLTLSGE